MQLKDPKKLWGVAGTPTGTSPVGITKQEKINSENSDISSAITDTLKLRELREIYPERTTDKVQIAQKKRSDGTTSALELLALKKISVERLPEAFEQTCDRRPDKTAIIYGSSRLTYLELDQRANRLARVLMSRGVEVGNTVGIYLERSPDMYAAILGVLKAGAAFVPLDLSFPADRVAFIAEDAQLRYLITTSAWQEKTSTLGCPVLQIDRVKEELALKSERRLNVRVKPTSLCYIIYTSGTTGKPKGVAVSHANITNFLRVVTPIYGVVSEDRVYQGMSVAFDFSIEEIWPTWIAGATLVAGPTDSRRLGHGLTEFLMEHEITVLYCVPTLLATIDSDVPSLRSLMVGGEACPADLVRRWSRPGRRMLNTYGPTETTVTATWGELFPDRPVTIGAPLPTYHVYILDEQLHLVEDGKSGEICIGGPGVAIGYVNRPDLTQNRFILNPIWRDREAVPHLYRTGDLGRITASGEIEYLGRIDTQVKIRGHRIELGEIEEVMREDQAVENAVVKPLEVNGTVQDLVGYVTLRDRSGKVALSDLRECLHASLRERLPYYMVPSFIEVLDSFPLLAADKVNRAVLPAPTLPRVGARTSSYVPATTPLEIHLAGVWGQLLGRERVSIEDDFFKDLGGHSLAAAQVISQLRQDPRLQGLGVGDLYQNPTISSLAQFILVTADRASDEQPVVRERLAPRRHSSLRVLSSGVVQMALIYGLLFMLSIPVIGLPWALNSLDNLVLFGVAGAIWLVLSSFLLPIVAGRVLMMGIKPGVYPLWGVIYLRWWLYRRLLALSPMSLLAGSPLLPPYLRLLGASIGRDCHISSAKIGLPMFVTIGDGTSIGYGAQLEPFHVESGWLRLGPISIGQDAFLGTNSLVQVGGRIGFSAVIAEQSLVAQDQVIPANECWGGSPCRRLQGIPPLLGDISTKADGRRWPISVLVGFVSGTVLLMLLPVLMVLPSVVLVDEVTVSMSLAWGIVSTLVAGPLFVFTTCTLVLIMKRAIMPVGDAGIYPLRSGFGLRKWLTDQLIAMSLSFTNTLYATLYLVPFLRLLGARIGKWSEVSTAAFVDPDMLILGDESFVADIAVIGPAVFHQGCVALAPAEVGKRSFVGNGALIPLATRLGDNSLIGVYSVPPSNQVDAGTSWLGSPAIFLPRRQESQHFNDNLTFRPRPSLVAWRLVIEYFRITLPATMLALALLGTIEVISYLAAMLSPLVLLALIPLFTIGSGMVLTLAVVLLKWLIIGRYRPRVEPLWSVFVRRSELITGLYEAVAVPSLVSLLTGTPWIAPVLRLFGARIGRRVWLDTTYLTEFDLVAVGNDAAVGDTTSLQTHLFEDRVMKMSTVKIGARSSVGSRAVVLYDAEVGPGASLDSLSLVMKGETLPAASQWRGIPARVI